MKEFKPLSLASQFLIFLMGICGSVAIGVLEMNTGNEISFAILYLIPISLVSWFTNGWYGFVVALTSSVMWLIFDLRMFPEHGPAIAYWNGAMRLGFYAIVSFLLSALEESYRRERALARIDRSTGAANGRYFFEMAENEVSRSKRYGGPITIVYMDIDNFKSINDHFGHRIGDELLRHVAETMKEHVRDSDAVARLGGDEFAILLPETKKDSADAVIYKVHDNLLQAMEKKNWPVTFSIGAVTFLQAPDSADEMIGKADELMYSVKNTGKNRVKHITLDYPVPTVPGSSRVEKTAQP